MCESYKGETVAGSLPLYKWYMDNGNVQNFTVTWDSSNGDVLPSVDTFPACFMRLPVHENRIVKYTKDGEMISAAKRDKYALLLGLKLNHIGTC